MRPFGDRHGLTIFFLGRNLLDQEARVHTSFIKEFAPLPGVDLRAGFRFDFGAG